MTERDLSRILTGSVQHVHLPEEARRKIRLAVHERAMPKVKKKMSLALALALMLVLMAGIGVAVSLGMFDFMNSKMGVRVLGGAESIHDVALTQTQYVTFYIREAAYDGRGASVMVEAVPKDEKTFLISESGLSLDDAANNIITHEDARDMTIREYGERKGFEQFVTVSGRFRNVGDVAMVDEWTGSSLLMVFNFATTGDEAVLDFEGYTALYQDSDSRAPGQTAKAQFTVKAKAPLWTARVTTEREVPSMGFVIHGATLTATDLGTYIDIDLMVQDVAAFERVSIRVSDEKSRQLSPGVVMIGGHALATEAGQHLVNSSCVTPMAEAPETLCLNVRNMATGEEIFVTLPVME